MDPFLTPKMTLENPRFPDLPRGPSESRISDPPDGLSFSIATVVRSQASSYRHCAVERIGRKAFQRNFFSLNEFFFLSTKFFFSQRIFFLAITFCFDHLRGHNPQSIDSRQSSQDRRRRGMSARYWNHEVVVLRGSTQGWEAAHAGEAASDRSVILDAVDAKSSVDLLGPRPQIAGA